MVYYDWYMQERPLEKMAEQFSKPPHESLKAMPYMGRAYALLEGLEARVDKELAVTPKNDWFNGVRTVVSGLMHSIEFAGMKNEISKEEAARILADLRTFDNETLELEQSYTERIPPAEVKEAAIERLQEILGQPAA